MPFQLRFSYMRFFDIPSTPVFLEISSFFREGDFFAQVKISHSGFIWIFEIYRHQRDQDFQRRVQSSSYFVKLFRSFMWGEHRHSLFIFVQRRILNSMQSYSFFIPQFFRISSCSFLADLTLLISTVLIIFLERSITLNSIKI